jgi:nitroreductase
MNVAGLFVLLSFLSNSKESYAFHTIANVASPHSLQSGKFGGKSDIAYPVRTTKTTFLQASSSTKSEKSSASSEVVESTINDNFDNVLQTRRTINSFLPDLPDDWEKSLENAIKSAIYAPNHKRTEPWRFHLLGPETIRKICKLNASIVAKKKGEKAGEKKLKRWLEMPGWVVVTCETKDGEGNMDKASGVDREDYAACCCAVQNLCLSLHNSGMGTKWTTGPVNFDPRFGEIVGLEENEFVVGTIWFGTPEKAPDAPKKKKDLKKVFIKHK